MKILPRRLFRTIAAGAVRRWRDRPRDALRPASLDRSMLVRPVLTVKQTTARLQAIY